MAFRLPGAPVDVPVLLWEEYLAAREYGALMDQPGAYDERA